MFVVIPVILGAAAGRLVGSLVQNYAVPMWIGALVGYIYHAQGVLRKVGCGRYSFFMSAHQNLAGGVRPTLAGFIIFWEVLVGAVSLGLVFLAVKWVNAGVSWIAVKQTVPIVLSVLLILGHAVLLYRSLGHMRK